MSFKLWLERNFISLPPSVEADIERITASVYPNAKISQGTLLGRVVIGSRKIKIVVQNLRTGDAAFDPITSTVYVTPATAKDRFRLKEMLYHELTHAYDPETAKLLLRNLQGQNARALDPTQGRTAYYNQRTEFNAYGSQLANYVSQALYKMPRQKADQYIAQLKDWLRKDDFPGFFGLIKSLFGYGMPKILIPFYSAQKAWKQDPKLWRQFKQKMFSLIQKLENPKVGSPSEFPVPD